MKTKNKNNLDLNSEELERYSRHLSLPQIGEEGQKKLKGSSVLCVGCGGLGSPLLIYLASAGIGHIGIIDSDIVEKSNLQRQIIHSTSAIGKEKVVSAKSRILEINPYCNVEIFNKLLTTDNALEIFKYFDIICDCTDNFESRYLINDASVILGKPNIYGAISRFEGQITVFNLTAESPSFRDLIPEPPPQELLPTCSQMGVIGVLPGLIGIIQATEVIKIITSVGDPLDGRLLVIDALKMKFRELRLKKSNQRKAIKKLIDYHKFCSSKNLELDSIKSISVNQLEIIIKNDSSNILLIDVRSKNEFNNKSIKESISIPLENIESGKAIKQLKKLSLMNKEIYIHCKAGQRSKKAILMLKEYGILATNISGGIDEWNKLKKQNHNFN